ncbi:hypothetical protein QFZ79_003365 [Arthrobacter sp. V4I6]|nr:MULTISPECIES: hypothetical protein [unclassified Arthrobacter]MDQ0820993.1 hypothetical protein [Arthrobacter sp. V1I7]MDQ0855254.1 hypothetical protein [Arthrobacter sp. V4I6]
MPVFSGAHAGDLRAHAFAGLYRSPSHGAGGIVDQDVGMAAEPGAEHGDHLIAWCERTQARAHGGDNAGNIYAQDADAGPENPWDTGHSQSFVKAAAARPVTGGAERARVDFDQHVACAGDGVGTSSTRTISGGPYRRYKPALIARRPHGAPRSGRRYGTHA